MMMKKKCALLILLQEAEGVVEEVVEGRESGKEGAGSYAEDSGLASLRYRSRGKLIKRLK